jgi:hypothetical protein
MREEGWGREATDDDRIEALFLPLIADINDRIVPEASALAVSSSDIAVLDLFRSVNLIDIVSGVCGQKALSILNDFSSLAEIHSTDLPDPDDGCMPSPTKESNRARRRRLASLRAPHADAWLNALPSGDTLMHNDVFHTSLATRYGLPVYDSAGEPCSACLEGRARKNREEAANPSIKKRARIPTGTQDAFGTHALNCKYGGGATRRHNALRDGVQAAARRGGFRAETELYIGSDPSSRKRDGDCVIFHFEGDGCDAAVDVGVTMAGQTKFSAIPAAIGSFNRATTFLAAKTMADIERSNALPRVNASITKFHALCVDHFGAWDEDSHAFLIKLGKRIGARTLAYNNESYGIRKLFQRLSIILQNRNHNIIDRRRPAADWRHRVEDFAYHGVI